MNVYRVFICAYALFMIGGKYFIGSLLCAVLFSACTKEDLTEPADDLVTSDTVTEIVDYIPVYQGKNAILVAITNYDYEELNGLTVENITGSARAIFPDQSGSYLNVGTVKVQDVALQQSIENRYLINPGSNLPAGVNFINSGSIRWEIGGNGSFPPVSFICAEGFPSLSRIICNPEIDRSADYTFSSEFPIDNADSVRFNVFAPNGYLFADKKGHHYSHTFESSKLNLLTTGNGYVRITAFKTVSIEVNGEQMQYLNESITTQAIRIK